MAKHRVDSWRFADMAVDRYRCAPGPPEWVEAHVHDEYQFCLGTGVACSYSYRRTRHVVPAGHLCVVHPGEPHSTRDEEARPPGSTYRMLYVDPILLVEAASELSGRRLDRPFFPTPVVADGDVLDLFRGVYGTVEGEADPLEREGVCLDALVRLVAAHAQGRVSARPLVSAPPAVARAREFLHANLTRKVSLAELAVVTGVSHFHLSRLFRRELGVPPHAYHLQIRVDRAKALLADGVPIVEAAREAGFYDQSQFARHFRRLVGTTPGSYERARIA